MDTKTKDEEMYQKAWSTIYTGAVQRREDYEEEINQLQYNNIFVLSSHVKSTDQYQ